MNNSKAVMKQAGQASGTVSEASRTGLAPGGGQAARPDVDAPSLQTVAAGILNGVSPLQFMSGIDAANRALGNRAFLQWVGALQSGREDAPAQDMAAPLQMMGKKKKKPGAQETAAGPGAAAKGGDAGAGPDGAALPPASAKPAPARAQGTGATGKSQGRAGPGMTGAQAQGLLPQAEPGAGEGAVGGGKKKKKSRTQVALNALRGEGVEAFGGYIEAEIGEAAVLRTLVERINRAQDLGGVRAEALARVEARLRVLDPGGQGREEPGIAAAAPVKHEISTREWALFDACYKGDVRKFRCLFRHGAVDVNISDNVGTMLCNAAYRGHTGIVRELLSVPGINVNLARRHGFTPLYMAAQEGHVKVVELLLGARDIDVNLATLQKATPLCVAAQCGHAEVVKALLDKKGINVNSATLDGTTPLYLAAVNGHKKVAELLLAAPGINIDAQKDDGTTALHFAAQKNFPSIVDLLVTHGADVGLESTEGKTPLFMAAINGYPEVVRALLQAPGIRVSQGGAGRFFPLSGAAQEGHKDIVSLLLGNGADPNVATADGLTALHFACLHGQVAVVEMLLRAGADMDAEFKRAGEEGPGHTPYRMAESKGHREVMSLLAAYRQHGEAVLHLPELVPVTNAPEEDT